MGTFWIRILFSFWYNLNIFQKTKSSYLKLEKRKFGMKKMVNFLYNFQNKLSTFLSQKGAFNKFQEC